MKAQGRNNHRAADAPIGSEGESWSGSTRNPLPASAPSCEAATAPGRPGHLPNLSCGNWILPLGVPT